MNFMRSVKILNGFVHDFASGCWLATVFAVYWLDRSRGIENPVPVLTEMKHQFFYAGVVCVAIVFATGAGRTFTYVDNYYGKDAERVRRRMLIIKHIILALIFGVGTYMQYRMAFRQ